MATVHLLQPFVRLVGTAGFGPATPGPPDQCATRLRHVPQIVELFQLCRLVGPLAQPITSYRATLVLAPPFSPLPCVLSSAACSAYPPRPCRLGTAAVRWSPIPCSPVSSGAPVCTFDANSRACCSQPG